MTVDGEVHVRVRTKYRMVRRTLILDLGGRMRVLSSAPQGGGLRLAAHILNHQVEPLLGEKSRPAAHFPDPARSLRILAGKLGVGADTVGLMTAVPMKQLITARVSAGDLWIECFATVGVTNAVRAGEWPPPRTRQDTSGKPGTINLMLITNGSLSHAAMVGAVQVATEAKTGVLRDHAVPSCLGGLNATGTGTDAVVIACRRRGQGPASQYSGTHTIIGALIGRVVAYCVAEGLKKAAIWHRRHR